ncbi:MAG TPA: anti-sigma factor [Terriglobia bacterium]|nr:anti-sigma factor [Terriglobia bacterium]
MEGIFDEYALGVLDAVDLTALEAHLRVCEECSHEAQEARARMALVASAAPQVTPPPGVRERLLQQTALHAPKPEPAREGKTRFWGWGVPIFAAAAAILAIAVGILVSRNHQLEQQLRNLETAQQEVLAAQARETTTSMRARALLAILTSPGAVKVSLSAAQAHPAPQGKAIYDPQVGLIFYAANLPRLPVGQTYQLWLVPSQGKPISAGVFQTDNHGNGEVLLPSLPPGVAAKAFAVTIEPAGGKPQPTGRKVLIGAAST